MVHKSFLLNQQNDIKPSWTSRHLRCLHKKQRTMRFWNQRKFGDEWGKGCKTAQARERATAGGLGDRDESVILPPGPSIILQIKGEARLRLPRPHLTRDSHQRPMRTSPRSSGAFVDVLIPCTSPSRRGPHYPWQQKSEPLCCDRHRAAHIKQQQHSQPGFVLIRGEFDCCLSPPGLFWCQ